MCFDRYRAWELQSKGHGSEIPPGPKSHMETTHIVPYMVYLNMSDGRAIRDPLAEIVRGVFSFMHLIHIRRQTERARSQEILHAWTRLDVDAVESVNSPSNAIFMSISEHFTFAKFEFYLDKEAVSFSVL